MKSIQDLTWKYFIEQKVYEIIIVFLSGILILTILYALPMAIGLSMGDGWSTMCGGDWSFDYDVARESPDGGIEYKCSEVASWVEGFLWLIIIGLIILVISTWFKENWKEAKEKAKQEIQKRKRRKR